MTTQQKEKEVIGFNTPWIEHHLAHWEFLEVATYANDTADPSTIRSVTVECTKCGCILHQLYDADYEPTPEENDGRIES
jgi:hypothetical protein